MSKWKVTPVNVSGGRILRASLFRGDEPVAHFQDEILARVVRDLLTVAENGPTKEGPNSLLTEQPGRLSFTLTVEVSSPGALLYRHFRDQITKCVNAFSNMRFVSIHEQAEPDHFLLEDPDKVPVDFK